MLCVSTLTDKEVGTYPFFKSKEIILLHQSSGSVSQIDLPDGPFSDLIFCSHGVISDGIHYTKGFDIDEPVYGPKKFDFVPTLDNLDILIKKYSPKNIYIMSCRASVLSEDLGSKLKVHIPLSVHILGNNGNLLSMKMFNDYILNIFQDSSLENECRIVRDIIPETLTLCFFVYAAYTTVEIKAPRLYEHLINPSNYSVIPTDQPQEKDDHQIFVTRYSPFIEPRISLIEEIFSKRPPYSKDYLIQLLYLRIISLDSEGAKACVRAGININSVIFPGTIFEQYLINNIPKNMRRDDYIKCLRLSIELGVNFNLSLPRRKPLLLEISEIDEEIALFLLDNGAKPVSGGGYMTVCARKGYLKLALRYFRDYHLKLNPKLDIKSELKFLPGELIHVTAISISNKNLEFVKLCIETFKVNPGSMYSGSTLIEYSRKAGNPEITEYLQSKSIKKGWFIKT